jgi:hypothetical protein
VYSVSEPILNDLMSRADAQRDNQQIVVSSPVPSLLQRSLFTDRDVNDSDILTVRKFANRPQHSHLPGPCSLLLLSLSAMHLVSCRLPASLYVVGVGFSIVPVNLMVVLAVSASQEQHVRPPDAD